MTDPRPAFAPSTIPEDSGAARILSVGIVGAGEIVSRIHLPVLSACEGVSIKYVADKNPETARSVASSYKLTPIPVRDDLEELPRTDIVLLAVPVNARLPYYEMFARRSTCVLAEKPLAVGVAAAEHLCGLYPDYALACGFQRRTYSTVVLARLLVSENWFGPLRSMSVSEGALTAKTGADSRFYDDAVSGGGGVLMDLGCHSLDMAMYISNAIEAVPTKQRFVFDGGVDREVEARLNLRTTHGCFDLIYLVTWLRPAKNSIELRFENCTVVLPCRPAQELEIRGRDNARFSPSLTLKQAGATTVYQAFYAEWMAFFDGVRTCRPSKINASSCLPTIRAIERLYRAGNP